MSTSYLNGQYITRKNAKISIEDRGFNFSDGVYEVFCFSNRNILDYKQHLKRLKRSLKEIKINFPFSNTSTLKLIIERLILINRINSGIIYLQITRGSSVRNHLFPENINSNIIINLYPEKDLSDVKKGIKVVTLPDLRWKRCDIKSISLLPNVLGKQSAKDLGVYEVWQTYGNEIISEGTTSNSFIVSKNNEIITHPSNYKILGGITRSNILKIAKKNKFKVLEKEFKLNQAYKSKEAFLTSSTVGILPVIKINQEVIGNGELGSVTKELMELFNSFLKKQIKKNE